MIPAFGKFGFLPPGIHLSDLNEFEKRFAYTIWRRELFKHLVLLIDDLRKINCRAIYIDGSFTTNKRIPNDMDVCWEDYELNYGVVQSIMPILFDLDYPRLSQQNKYKADIFPAHLYEAASGKFFIDFFQIDKATGLQKGIVEIKIT